MESRLLLMTCSVCTYPANFDFDFNRCKIKKLPSVWSRVRASRYRRWDSNAETTRTRRFNFNLRNGDVEDEEEDNDVENDYYFSSRSKESGLLYEVLRSYGWMLPFIILSLLAISGPKAFFLSLAVGIGLSTMAFAVEKLLRGPPRNRPKRKYRRTNRKSSPRAQYRSWEGGSHDVSVEQDGASKAPSFGGWDELDNGMDTMGTVKRPARTGSGFGRKKAEKSRLSWEKQSDMPLLLRLLIAAFPFLNSWTKFF